MNMEVKNTIKPFDYIESMKILEKRVDDVILGKKDELLWILEHETVYTVLCSKIHKSSFFFSNRTS